MITYLLLDEDGYVTQRQSSSTPPENYIEDDIDWNLRPTQHHSFHYPTKTWVDRRSTDEVWAHVRMIRNTKLSSSDWTQLPDVPLATKEVWATYRQALRDITQQSDPFNVTFPEPPK